MSESLERKERRPDPYRDQDWLYENYVEKGFSLAELSRAASCSLGTIRNWLDFFGIPRRTRQETLKRWIRRRVDVKWDLLDDPEWLRRMYWDEEFSLPDLAEMIGCNVSTIGSSFQTHEIPQRTRSEAHSTRRYRQKFSEGVRAQERFSSIKWDRLDDREWLHWMYWEEEYSTTDLAGIVNCGFETVRSYLQEHGIPLRSRSEQRATQRCRQKISEGLRAAHARGCFDIVCSPSKPELAVAKVLDTLDIPYEQQFRPEGMSRPFDFLLSGTTVFIEVQGTYWHSGEEMKAWDQEKAQEANERGYRVFEIWEDTIWDLGVEEAVRVTLARGDNNG